MLVPEDLKYAETHEWIRLEGATGVVGITDHAQTELTDVVFVELPQVGAVLEAHQAVAVVESVKAASDIYSPVAGEVVAVNSELESNPALVNTDPYGAGWLFKVKLSNPAEISSLKTAADYRSQIGA
ncbi:MAG TPA: glycine cleavage system protein GcvH [Chthoniobacterales bacterium]|nr:glycine cleavage system protein GcvH [Chthoniobacterales bacterium]